MYLGRALEVAATTAIFVLVGYTLYLKSELIDSDNRTSKAIEKFVHYKLEANYCTTQLETANGVVADLETNSSKLNLELSKWQNKKPEIKFVTITKIREVKSNECEDVNSTLDVVRSINFNEL